MIASCLDRAIRLNRYYARALGWQSHLQHILRMLGLGGYHPNEGAFASAVARWQRQWRLPVNGIIVPSTWYLMLKLDCPPSLQGPGIANVVFSDLLSGLGAPDEFLCVAGGTTRLNNGVIDGVANTRLLAGETLPISSPVCAATTLCPTAFQPPHTTGDATHFVRLDRNLTRVVELAGLFGVNLSSITGSRASRVSKKASTAVKSLPSAPPLGALGFVALRGSKREVHIHQVAPADVASRPVQSIVNGDEWNSLAFRATPGSTYTLVKRRWHEASLHRQWGKKATIDWVIGLCSFYQDRAGLRLGIGDISTSGEAT